MNPQASNFDAVLNGLHQEFLRLGGDFECSRNVNHINAEAAHRDALLHASGVLLQRLRLERGLELRQKNLRVGHRALLHWRQASDPRDQGYLWHQTRIGTLPAVPTYVGYVYWLPELPPSNGGGELGTIDVRFNLMGQMVHRH